MKSKTSFRYVRVSAIFILLLIVSCDRSEPDGQFFVRGQLLENCSEAPASDVPVQVIYYWGYKRLLGRAKNFSAIVGTGQTDSTGRFEIPCDYQDDEGQIRLRVNGQMYDLMNVEIENREHDCGVIYRTGTFQTRVRVNTTRTFSASDTLFLLLYGDTLVTVSPIVPGLVPAVLQKEHEGLPRDAEPERLYLTWSIGREEFEKPIPSLGMGGSINFYGRPCDTSHVVDLDL